MPGDVEGESSELLQDESALRIGAQSTLYQEPPSSSLPQKPLTLVCETAIGTEAVSVESIVMIRAEKKNVWLLRADTAEEILLRQTMKSLEERICAIPRLVRCHRSLIVNLQYCPLQNPKGKDSSVCIVQGEKQEWKTVSRKYKQEFLRRWHFFYGSPTKRGGG